MISFSYTWSLGIFNLGRRKFWRNIGGFNGEYLREFENKPGQQTKQSHFIRILLNFHPLSSIVASNVQRTARVSYEKNFTTLGKTNFLPREAEFFPPLCLEWLNADPFLNFFPVIDSRVSFLFFLPFFLFFLFQGSYREVLGSNAIFSRWRGLKGTKGRLGEGDGKKSERVGNVLFRSRCKECSREFDVIRIPRGVSSVTTVTCLLQFHVAFIKSFPLSF